MVVDFFPIMGSTSFIYKVLKFKGVDTMSTSCISAERFYAELIAHAGLYASLAALQFSGFQASQT